MDTGRRLIERCNTTLFFQESRLGVKSAFVGSIVFAFVELASVFINTYWIQRINAPLSIEGVLFAISWVVVLILLGSALAFSPALLLGGLLANLLNKDVGKHVLSERNAFAKGALLGMVAGIMICLPILLIEYYFIQQSGHGNFTVFIYRAIEAILIASFSGGWTGKQLVKRFIKRPPNRRLQPTCLTRRV